MTIVRLDTICFVKSLREVIPSAFRIVQVLINQDHTWRKNLCNRLLHFSYSLMIEPLKWIFKTFQLRSQAFVASWRCQPCKYLETIKTQAVMGDAKEDHPRSNCWKRRSPSLCRFCAINYFFPALYFFISDIHRSNLTTLKKIGLPWLVVDPMA